MKVLVAYKSQTGNTRKIAEAIFGEIQEEKEIKRIADVDSLEGYDLVLDISGAVLYVKPELDLDEKIEAALKARG